VHGWVGRYLYVGRLPCADDMYMAVLCIDWNEWSIIVCADDIYTRRRFHTKAPQLLIHHNIKHGASGGINGGRGVHGQLQNLIIVSNTLKWFVM